jgi:hypothetical protein
MIWFLQKCIPLSARLLSLERGKTEQVTPREDVCRSRHPLARRRLLRPRRPPSRRKLPLFLLSLSFPPPLLSMAGSRSASPESVSSARPVISGLGLSSASGAGSSSGSPPTVEAPERCPVQDRLVWQQPKLSCKAAWRRRKREQQQLLQLQAGPSRPMDPAMKGVCFRCLRGGASKAWMSQR